MAVTESRERYDFRMWCENAGMQLWKALSVNERRALWRANGMDRVNLCWDMLDKHAERIWRKAIGSWDSEDLQGIIAILDRLASAPRKPEHADSATL